MLAFTSCTTVRKSAVTADIDTSIKQFPTVADLKVKTEKVEKSYHWYWQLFKKDEDLSALKGNLIAELLKEQNGDILLEPQFIFQKTSFGPRSLSVSGYVACYENFRKATDKDLEALAITNTAAPNEKTVYNSGNGLLKFLKKFKR